MFLKFSLKSVFLVQFPKDIEILKENEAKPALAWNCYFIYKKFVGKGKENSPTLSWHVVYPIDGMCRKMH